MYQLFAEIPNQGPGCLSPEVAFTRDGRQFVVSYLDYDEVRIYNAADCTLARTYSNPDAELDKPHGVLVTDKHLIIANRHLEKRPATYTVYRLDSESSAPVFTLQTPVDHLLEAHSLAMRNDLLVATHCEHDSSLGALLSYRFNDDTGEIHGPPDFREDAFDDLGMAKGVAFLPDRGVILVSFNSDKQLSRRQKLAFRLFKAWNIVATGGLRGVANRLDPHRQMRSREKAYAGNGVALFDVDDQGRFSAAPRRVMLRREFCRLENVAVNDDAVAITDTVNHRVQIYDLARDPDLENPTQCITRDLSLPHGVKFSPDGRMIVVTNYGLRSYNQLVHWQHFRNPRGDKVMVYKRQ